MRSPRVVLALLFAAVITVTTGAQAFVATPGVTYKSVPVGTTDVTFYVPIQASGLLDENVHFTWEAHWPTVDWFGQYCIGIACYWSEQDLNVRAAPDRDTLKVTVFPSTFEAGVGWVRMQVWNVDDPGERTTLTFTVFNGVPVPAAGIRFDSSDNSKFLASGTQMWEFFSPLKNTGAQNDSLYCYMETASPGWFVQYCQASTGACLTSNAHLDFNAGVQDTLEIGFLDLTNGKGGLDLEIHSALNPSVFRTGYYRVFVGNNAAGVIENTRARTEGIPSWVRPNPSAGVTELLFGIDVAGAGRLEILSADGRRVRTFAQVALAPGLQRVAWDGTDEAGRPVATGTYFYRLETAAGIARGSVLRIR